MKAIRVTMFPPPGGSIQGPITMIARESDLGGEIGPEDARFFDVRDEFEIPEGASEIEVVLMGAARASRAEETEGHMATAFYWWSRMIQVARLVWSDRPAPLKTEDVVYVFQRVAKHPAYVSQTVQAFDINGISVRLEKGVVKIGGHPTRPKGW